jgi:uncharacterized membrane protein YgcG
MQLGANADGELLQRALEEQPVDDAGIASLVAVVRGVEGLEQRGLAPRANFVAALRQRLLDEPAGSDPARPDPAPAVLRFGRKARFLLAAAAVLLVLAGGLGALSRSALPGDRLYPVKQLIDRVVLELHRDPLGVGLTHLAQARAHVDEAEQLIVRARDEAGGTDRGAGPTDGGAAPTALDADLTSALDAAADSSTQGRTVLLEAYRSLQQAGALTSLADYYAEVVPAVEALTADPLPSAATAAWQRLHDLLVQDRDSTVRELAACTICGDASARAKALLAGQTPTARTSGTPDGTSGSPASRSTGPASGPTSSPRPRQTSSAGSASSAGSSSGSGGGSSSTGGIVRLPTVGVTSTSVSAGGGGVSLPAPLPTVSLPGAGVNTSGVTVGGGGVTLPGATLSVSTVTVPLP